MKVLFSCHVTKSGGAGHLLRSVSIAEYARERGFEVLFCGRFETPLAESVLSARGFACRDFRGDSESLAFLASQEGVTVVHCDDYAARPNLHEALSRRGVALSTIEDGAYGSRSADIIVDPSPYAESAYRQNAPTAIHLRGLSYVPLRQAITTAATAQPATKYLPGTLDSGKFKVLIILGGTDAAGATKDIVSLWMQTVPNTVCIAIMPDQKAAVTETKGTSKIQWIPPSDDVATLFSKVDAIITAAGTTVWEILTVGVPAAVVRQADNQLANYQYVVEAGAMLGMGSVDELSVHELEIQAIMRRLVAVPANHALNRSLIDFEGASRIVNEWSECASRTNAIRLRQARLSDASNLFDWRNDASVRAASREAESLEWADHVQWLRSVVSDPDRKLLVAGLQWRLVGTVRFDRISINPNVWEISLTLSPALRGQGYGHELLRRAEQWLRSHTSGHQRIVAFVRPGNDASSQLFIKNGYEPVSGIDSQELMQWSKHLT